MDVPLQDPFSIGLVHMRSFAVFVLVDGSIGRVVNGSSDKEVPHTRTSLSLMLRC